MSTIVSRPNGARDLKSRNLRGIIDYARVSYVKRVEIRPKDRWEAFLDVYYADGAVGYATFASRNVCTDWVARRRSWRGCEVINHCELSL